MQLKKKFHFMIAPILTAALFLAACAKPSSQMRNLPNNPSANPQNTTPDLLNDQGYDLEPTISDEKIKATGYEYEPTPKTIETKQATLQLDKVKIKNVVVNYDAINRKFSIKGLAVVLDNEKNEIDSNTFSLESIHDADDNTFRLKNTDPTKVKSNEKPVVRASVTCLNTHSDDTIDCSKAVVDFFIAYKKQIYTEQMETVQKSSSKPAAPVKPAPAAQPAQPAEPVKPAQPNPSTEQTTPAQPKPQDVSELPDNVKSGKEDGSVPLQIEKEDDSILGRYQGQVQTTDLSKEFDQDDEIQTVLKPETKVSNPKTESPKPTTADQSATPKPAAPSAQTPKPGPTTPAVPATKTPAPPVVKQPTNPAVPATTPTAPTTTTTPPTTNQQTTPAQKPPVSTGPETEAATPPPSPSNPVNDVTPIKPVSSTMAQLIDGSLRFINQAIGLTDSGKLRNATSLLERQKALNSKAYFEVVAPSQMMYFATYEMAEMIVRMGAQLNQIFNKKLAVSDISRIKGGPSSPHASHQIGMDADLGYPSTDAKKFPRVATSAGLNTKAYSAAKTYDLFKFAFLQKDIEVARIFVDQRIIKDLCGYAKSTGQFVGSNKAIAKKVFENLQHVDGHGDHFHLRLKCGPAQKTCRDRVYRVMNQCG